MKNDPVNPKRIVFPEGGMGQALIGADDITGDNLSDKRAVAPGIFAHLSARLLKDFNYLNKNFTSTTEGERILQTSMPLTNQMVRDIKRAACAI